VESARRTRVRTPTGDQPAPDEPVGPYQDAPDGHRWCLRCRAWVLGVFVHGELKTVQVVHRYNPCRARLDLLPLADWRGQIDPTRPRHADPGWHRSRRPTRH